MELAEVWCRFSACNAFDMFDYNKALGHDILKDHPDDLPPEMHEWHAIARSMTLADRRRDLAVQTRIYEAMQALLGPYRLIVTPTVACLPVPNEPGGNTRGPATINGEPMNRVIGWCMTYPVNFTGHPAASVPAGLSKAQKLPVGMQIIGRRYADADVFAAAAAIETHRPWKDAYRIAEARPVW